MVRGYVLGGLDWLGGTVGGGLARYRLGWTVLPPL